MAKSVLDYYSQLGKVSGDRMKSLSTLVRLTSFFKCVFKAVQQHLRPEAQVNLRGVGTQTVTSSLDAQRGLLILEELGMMPASSAMMQQAPSTAPSMLTSDVDYGRINTKAESLRREFNDMVLRLLSPVFLGAGILLLLTWRDAGRDRSAIAQKSRQLTAFVAAVGRWHKISSEVRRRLVSIDELMVY